MIDENTNYIEIDAKPFSGVTYEVVDNTSQSIGIGTISIVVASKEATTESESVGSDEMTASEATEDGSLITLKWLQGNDTVNVEEVNGTVEKDVSLDDMVALD